MSHTAQPNNKIPVLAFHQTLGVQPHVIIINLTETEDVELKTDIIMGPTSYLVLAVDVKSHFPIDSNPSD